MIYGYYAQPIKRTLADINDDDLKAIVFREIVFVNAGYTFFVEPEVPLSSLVDNSQAGRIVKAAKVLTVQEGDIVLMGERVYFTENTNGAFVKALNGLQSRETARRKEGVDAEEKPDKHNKVNYEMVTNSDSPTVIPDLNGKYDTLKKWRELLDMIETTAQTDEVDIKIGYNALAGVYILTATPAPTK